MPFWRADRGGAPSRWGGRSVVSPASSSRWHATRRPRVCSGSTTSTARRAEPPCLPRDQRAATGVLPDDRTIVLERTRDEMGTGASASSRPGVVGSTRRGDRARGAAAAGGRGRGRVDLERRRDRAPPARTRAPAGGRGPPARARGDRGPRRAGAGGTSLFAARFREAAARALLLPRRKPGQRTPLWMQAEARPRPSASRRALPFLPDRARGLPRVPARRVRPAGLVEIASRVRRPRDPPRHRGHPGPSPSRRRSSSGTSPTTSTKATPRSPSAAPRPWPWTRPSSRSSSARRSCGSSSTAGPSPSWSWRSSASTRATRPRAPSGSTTCCSASATSPCPRRRLACTPSRG